MSDPLTVKQATGVRSDTKAKQLTAQEAAQDKKLRKACADFEAMFTFYLFKTMRQTVPTGHSINQSAGKDTFHMLMDQKIAEELSKKNSGLGIQKLMYNQLVKKVNNISDK